jgi:hypothetical protein
MQNVNSLGKEMAAHKEFGEFQGMLFQLITITEKRKRLAFALFFMLQKSKNVT